MSDELRMSEGEAGAGRKRFSGGVGQLGAGKLRFFECSEHVGLASRPSFECSGHVVLASRPSFECSGHVVLASRPSFECSGHVVLASRPSFEWSSRRSFGDAGGAELCIFHNSSLITLNSSRVGEAKRHAPVGLGFAASEHPAVDFLGLGGFVFPGVVLLDVGAGGEAHGGEGGGVGR